MSIRHGLVLVLSLAATGSAFATDPFGGSRPRAVSVSPDGATILTTSMGSTEMVQTRFSETGGVTTLVSTPLPLGGESWGVVFLDDLTAAVTMPMHGELAILTRADAASDFTLAGSHPTELRGTEIVAHPGQAGHVLVAFRGATLDSETTTGAWTHVVRQIDTSSGVTVREWITEREPRALAVSRTGNVLFVATVAGALGQAGLAASHPLADKADDGGSIVAFDMATCQPLHRFAVGSPVRGLLVWPPTDMPPGAQVDLPAGHYRLFFTHVGEGAQGEDPRFGGRLIPNVISSIAFDGSDQPLGSDPHDGNLRENVLFDHLPGAEFTAAAVSASLPAVLPEKMIARWGSLNGVDGWQLWVNHSASGTVSRMKLDNSGRVDVQPIDGAWDTVRHDLAGFTVLDLSSRGSDMLITSAMIQNAGAGNTALVMPDGSGGKVADVGKVADPLHVHTGAAGEAKFTSNPRTIAYDLQNDRIWVATHLEHRLVEIRFDAQGQPLRGERHDLAPLLPAPTPEEAQRLEREKNFFTFGEGFNFRESGALDKVNNLSCGTCHVDGHIDGKVRLTVRDFNNTPSPVPDGTITSGGLFGKPVAVPSVFDSGPTEWMFFEGLRTTLDREELFPWCEYCFKADFFPDTLEFAATVETPASPYADAGTLDSAELKGRFLFESMNCSRCHAGPVAAFERSDESETIPSFPPNPPTVLTIPKGPIVPELKTENRLLFDAAQVFVTNEDPLPVEHHSRRNMTDVGTRDPADANHNGINTPALAGAWDARPYMHDGRYRTLREVLDNTWLNPAWAYRAAELSSKAIPDNAFNDALTIGPPVPSFPGVDLHPFGTHMHGGGPSGWVTVSDEASQDLDDLVAFLNAASAQTDLCGPDADGATLFSSATVSWAGSAGTATWTSSVPIITDWKVRAQGSPTVLASGATARATSHSAAMGTLAVGDYAIEVTARMRTVCGEDAVRSSNFTRTAAGGGCRKVCIHQE